MAGVDSSSLLTSLDGTAWRGVRFGPSLTSEPPADAEFSLEILGDQFAGQSGCNRYFGTWVADGDAIRCGPFGSTMMYCDGLMELERVFLDALGGIVAVELRDGRLVLLGADGAPRAEFVAAPPTPDASDAIPT
jgi:heat shock protein HslJ